MSDEITHIKISQDEAARVSSTAQGANINAIVFNIDFIASKNPTLALELMKLYKRAHAISPDDPEYPEEDYRVALDKLKDL